MDEKLISVGFKKFLHRFIRSLERIIGKNFLTKTLVVVTTNSVRIYVIEDMIKVSLRRVFKTDYSEELITYLKEHKVSEFDHYDLPATFVVNNCWTLFYITKMELVNL